MKINIKIYKIIDYLGTVDYEVVSDSCSIIYLSGTNDKGYLVSFESEAYHVEQWAADNDFKFELIEKEIEI